MPARPAERIRQNWNRCQKQVRAANWLSWARKMSNEDVDGIIRPFVRVVLKKKATSPRKFESFEVRHESSKALSSKAFQELKSFVISGNVLESVENI